MLLYVWFSVDARVWCIFLTVQAEIELGNGLPDVRLTKQCLEALKQAGFEVGAKIMTHFLGLLVMSWSYVKTVL